MAQKAQTGFETFADVLKNMPPEHKDKLIRSHQRFAQLRTWCEAKGHTKNLPNLTGIHVYQNTPEVKEMRELVDFLKPGKFKWSYEDKKLQAAWLKKEEALNQK